MGGLDKLLETLRQRLAEQKRPPSGRQEMDRHRRHLAVRRLRLQSRRRAHRPGHQPQFPRRESVGQARVQGSRRRRRTRHPQHQDRAAPPAQIRPHRRAGRARSRRHHQGHRAQGLSRYPDAAGAAQHHQGAAVPRRRRLDGLARQGDRGIVLRRQDRVQASGASLLPQLPLRESVEAERAALDRDDADLGRAAHLSARLQGDLRRRRLDVALRDRGAGRLGRAFQRGGRAGLDGARRRDLSVLRLAQSGARARMGHDRPRSA